jgi:hypothetical protein
MGATPPLATGVANVTVVGLLLVAVTVTSDGQVIVKPGRWSPGGFVCDPGGRVGLVGEEQPATRSRSASHRVRVRVVSTKTEL